MSEIIANAMKLKSKLTFDPNIKPLHQYMHKIENEIIKRDHELFFDFLEGLLKYKVSERMENFSKYFLHNSMK